jgi:DNA replication and repair protein RecF
VWLRRLELQNFRNIGSAALDLSAGFNFFHGLNGAGKTAVLEAVHVIGRGRSFRTQHLQDVIQRGHDRLIVRAVVEDEHVGLQRLAIGRSRAGETEIRINGEPGRRMSQMAALMPMEVVTPDLVELVFGGPAVRRQWLDWGVFHVEHDYMSLLRRYSAAVRQRNAGLKSIVAGKLPLKALEPWTAEVALLGEHVTSARVAHLDGIRAIVADVVSRLSEDLEIEISYRRGWSDEIALANVLGEQTGRELKLGSTLAGPHRADVELRTRGQLCSMTLSRGQAKVLASALMLAQADHVRRSASRSGLFLIDDIGAELDERHRNRFFEALIERGIQVLATSVDPPDGEVRARCADHAMFHVEHGVITQHHRQP